MPYVSNDITIAFDQLSKGFLTPTYLSSVFFHYFLKEQKTQLTDEQLTTLAGSAFTYHINPLNSYEFYPTCKSDQYIIHFPGNGQDALNERHIQDHLLAAPNVNHIFFNYPPVYLFAADECSPEKWFNHAYLQINNLLSEKNIPAENITISAWSMGCGVACHVARRLYEEGHATHLLLDRGFSNTKITLESQFKASFANKSSATILSASINGAFFGLGTGVLLSRSIATLGLLIGGMISAVGYSISYVFNAAAQQIDSDPNHRLRWSLSFIGNVCNVLFDGIGFLIYTLGRTLGTLVSLVELLGLVVGTGLGAMLGAVFSANQLFGYEPILFSFATFDYFAKLVFAQLETDKELAMLTQTPTYQEKGGHIVSINTTDDWLVKPPAAISTYMTEHSSLFTKSTKTVWFNRGDHGNTLMDPVAPEDPNATYATVLQGMHSSSY